MKFSRIHLDETELYRNRRQNLNPTNQKNKQFYLCVFSLRTYNVQLSASEGNSMMTNVSKKEKEKRKEKMIMQSNSTIHFLYQPSR